jgi:hypothetical protein
MEAWVREQRLGGSMSTTHTLREEYKQNQKDKSQKEQKDIEKRAYIRKGLHQSQPTIIHNRQLGKKPTKSQINTIQAKHYIREIDADIAKEVADARGPNYVEPVPLNNALNGLHRIMGRMRVDPPPENARPRYHQLMAEASTWKKVIEDPDAFDPLSTIP